MITSYTHEGITIDHPLIMGDGTIQLVIAGAYYEFSMQDIISETEANTHPEDWAHTKECLHETFDVLSVDLA